MKPRGVALVAPADKARSQIAKYLRDGGYEVMECEELAIATRFVAVVIVDDPDDGEVTRTRVQSWIKPTRPIRVVVISAKPAAWRPLSLALGDPLIVLAAPAFGWEIVDALRAAPPELPGRA